FAGKLTDRRDRDQTRNSPARQRSSGELEFRANAAALPLNPSRGRPHHDEMARKSGRLTLHVVPTPSVEVSFTSPRRRRTISLTTVNPSPVPSRSLVVKKGSNTFGTSKLGMPCPSSRTSSTPKESSSHIR